MNLLMCIRAKSLYHGGLQRSGKDNNLLHRLARVKASVEKDGHNIPPNVIERRYVRGLRNFFTLYYIKSCEIDWIVYDNSNEVIWV